jgi:glycerophosphoryl diester phosphodiesterase
VTDAVGVKVSAHRCNSLELVEAALALGVEYVEFDLQLVDGRLVVAHDADEAPRVSYDAVLAALAGRAKAHLDLKFRSPAGTYEVAAVTRAIEVLGAEAVLVTTLEDDSVRAVRRWWPDLAVGLSLGRSVRGLPWRRQVAVRFSELRPARRFAACGADVVVAKDVLARLGVRRWARRRGLDLVVWTVDRERALRWWTRPGRAAVVTTNRPGRALELRVRR